jgi:hypothetical protein
LLSLGGGVGVGVGGGASLEAIRAWYLPCNDENWLWRVFSEAVKARMWGSSFRTQRPKLLMQFYSVSSLSKRSSMESCLVGPPFL